MYVPFGKEAFILAYCAEVKDILRKSLALANWLPVNPEQLVKSIPDMFLPDISALDKSILGSEILVISLAIDNCSQESPVVFEGSM